MREYSFFCYALFTIFACGTSMTRGQEPIFFANVNVFDGQRRIEATNVSVSEGKIFAIGRDVKPREGSTTIDGGGKTLIPGMIDCHTHVWFESQLVQAAMFGVTTELDMMSVPEAASSFRKQQGEGQANRRADFFSAGAAVTVAKGHGTQFGFHVPTLDSSENATQFVNERVREGSDYIKLIYEDGSAYGISRPTITPEMMIATIKAAHAREKLAVAHVSTMEGARLAIESGIDGLVHLFAEQVVEDEVVELAKERGIFVVPTASVLSNVSGDDLTNMILGDANLVSMLTRANLANLTRRFPQREGLTNSWDNLKRSIRRFHEAGVPILVGTDAPNPGTDHGVSMHHEVRLLVDAGLSPEQALAAATSVPATCFGLNDRGRIAAGLRADLFLVAGDPTADIELAADIIGVWKGGYAIDRDARRRGVNSERQKANPSVAADGPRPISDFEDDGGKIESKFGAGWMASTDSIMGGDSTVTMKVVGGGADNTENSLRISGATRAQEPAFSGIMFSPGAVPMQAGDISGQTRICFWAKGSGETCQVMFFFQKRGFMPSTKEFVAKAEWARYAFSISDFDSCDGTDVIGIWFGRTAPGEFAFQIDEVTLE